MSLGRGSELTAPVSIGPHRLYLGGIQHLIAIHAGKAASIAAKFSRADDDAQDGHFPPLEAATLMIAKLVPCKHESSRRWLTAKLHIVSRYAIQRIKR